MSQESPKSVPISSNLLQGEARETPRGHPEEPRRDRIKVRMSKPDWRLGPPGRVWLGGRTFGLS
eukprot:6003616-Pyramimonas_sp.AAC.1